MRWRRFALGRRAQTMMSHRGENWDRAGEYLPLPARRAMPLPRVSAFGRMPCHPAIMGRTRCNRVGPGRPTPDPYAAWLCMRFAAWCAPLIASTERSSADHNRAISLPAAEPGSNSPTLAPAASETRYAAR